jgi:hypothetical protein
MMMPPVAIMMTTMVIVMMFAGLGKVRPVPLPVAQSVLRLTIELFLVCRVVARPIGWVQPAVASAENGLLPAWRVTKCRRLP